MTVRPMHKIAYTVRDAIPVAQLTASKHRRFREIRR